MTPISKRCLIMSLIIICLTFLLSYALGKANPQEDFSDESCPSDCICYPDYLSNLESWKWIKGDIHVEATDLEHDKFNPYTEHNEVYESPKAMHAARKELHMRTVTCILRFDEPTDLQKLLVQIHHSTQVLSLIQAQGSGNITIERSWVEHLSVLLGLDIQGHRRNNDQGDPIDNVNSITLEADALSPLRSLKFLSLQQVRIQQRSIENMPVEYSPQILRLTQVNNRWLSRNNNMSNGPLEDMSQNEVDNNVVQTPQLMIMDPDVDNETQEDEETTILPYSVYKKKSSGRLGPRPFPMRPVVAVAFTGIPTLIHLRISECNMQDFSWDMFFKLDSLKYLFLERNDLLFLPDFVFFATPNLTALSLAGNRILSLQTVGLAGLLYLQKLDVSNNNITHLSELSLPPFPHLEVADFRNNPTEAIFPNTFEVMNSTKTLYIGSPSVSLEIFQNSFYGLIVLTKLDITNVKISFLERQMLKGMPELSTLVMTGQITRISFDAFSEVAKLQKLVLHKCSIKKISMDAFYGLTSLREIDLSHNDLTFLPPGIFDDQVSLREIQLQGNELRSLPPNLFLNTPVKMIRLEKNPWHCSCELSSWDSSLINKVKRYYISKNDTFCQTRYDKGSMCLPEHTSFQVTYAYEKRVSPVCETPQKFVKRSVFEVMRKEFKYCSLTKLSHPKKAHLTKEAQIKIKGPKWNIVKSEDEIQKELEIKEFYESLIKVKKPHQMTNVTVEKLIKAPVQEIPKEQGLGPSKFNSGISTSDHPRELGLLNNIIESPPTTKDLQNQERTENVPIDLENTGTKISVETLKKDFSGTQNSVDPHSIPISSSTDTVDLENNPNSNPKEMQNLPDSTSSSQQLISNQLPNLFPIVDYKKEIHRNHKSPKVSKVPKPVRSADMASLRMSKDKKALKLAKLQKLQKLQQAGALG